MKNQDKNDKGVKLMPHSYDGIQEYDQKLPNWWLFTLYAAIVFSVFYWFVFFVADSPGSIERLERDMALIEKRRLESSIDISNNDLFWQAAASQGMVVEGQKIFETNCVVCHGIAMTGMDASTGANLPGVSLVDNQWIHGNRPSDIYQTIFNGVMEKGMQAWGAQLGQERIVKVVAYILSKHGDRETMESQAVAVPSGT